MKHYKSLSLIVLCLVTCISCLSRSSSTSEGSEPQSEILDYTKYAEGYTIKQYKNIKLLEIKDPTGGSSTQYKYALMPKGSKSDEIPEGYQPLEIPLQRVICMTTLQLSPFIKLNLADRIVGVTSTRFLQNPELNKRLKSKAISRIGIEGEFDTEVVLSLDPDVIVVSPFKRGGYQAIENLNIPMLAYLGYKEQTPLAQAEWIKLIGLLTGTEELAQSEFKKIETEYLALMDLVANVEHRPKILSGELHSGNWYVVGGQSSLAQQFRDAGAEYFMTNDSESGGFYVDYETVYAEGYNADFWRIANSFNGEYSYSELLSSDGRYKDFAPFTNKKVVYCNLREKPFYENTPMQPEVVLADLIKIFHPTLLPSHEAVYYELLK